MKVYKNSLASAIEGKEKGSGNTSSRDIVAGYCAEDDVPDFHELGADIERQFHELSALDDAIFIDG